MPRDLPLGNGRLLITFDREYHIRDLYYPRVGGENHASGHPFRFGVWADGEFGWGPVWSDAWSGSRAQFRRTGRGCRSWRESTAAARRLCGRGMSRSRGSTSITARSGSSAEHAHPRRRGMGSQESLARKLVHSAARLKPDLAVASPLSKGRRNLTDLAFDLNNIMKGGSVVLKACQSVLAT